MMREQGTKQVVLGRSRTVKELLIAGSVRWSAQIAMSMP